MISFFIWLFKFIPEYLIYGLIFLGIAGYLVQMFLPIPVHYKLGVKIGSIIIFVLGFYLLGMIQVVKEYESQRIEFEHKLEVAEVQSQVINEKIRYVYKDRVTKVKEKTGKVQENINSAATEINRDCKINPDVISIHNAAAEGLK